MAESKISSTVLLLYACLFVANMGTSNACDGCTTCVACLTKPTNSKEANTPKEYLQIDKGMCPDKCSPEYSCLQQIKYMYRDEIINNQSFSDAPCLDECSICVKKMKNMICKIQPLQKNYLETLVDGIFFPNADIYSKTKVVIKPEGTPDDSSRPRPHLNPSLRPFRPHIDRDDPSRPKPNVTPQGNPEVNATESPFTLSRNRTIIRSQMRFMFRNRTNLRTRRDPAIGCGTTKSVTAFLSTLTDIDGDWHPIWFNTTSLNCQYYEEITCSPGSGCTLYNTIQSFVVTPQKPHDVYGHSFHLFNHYWLHNVKFKNVYVGGYCDI